jgi:hypothetical protein
MRVRSLALVAVLLAAGSPAGAQTPVDAACALVARYHEDPAALDRAKAEEHFKKALEIAPTRAMRTRAASCSESSTRPARR